MAGTFHGGVHPCDAKSLSQKCEIGKISLPSEVVLPVSQHIGAPAVVVVGKDEHVKKGQMIAEAGGFVSAPVHASISGVVKAIVSRYTPLATPFLSPKPLLSYPMTIISFSAMVRGLVSFLIQHGEPNGEATGNLNMLLNSSTGAILQSPEMFL